MKDLVYEKNLHQMKFAILTSAHHKVIINSIAGHLGVSTQKLRKNMIERLDMMSLESLGIRYESWEKTGDKLNPVGRSIGYDLYTRYIPLIPAEFMDRILHEAEDEIEQGLSVERAVSHALSRIRENLT